MTIAPNTTSRFSSIGRTLKASAVALLLSTAVPLPASAVTITDPTQDAVIEAGFLKDLAQLANIFSSLDGILSLFEPLESVQFPSGFTAATAAVNAHSMTESIERSDQATYLAQSRDYTNQRALQATYNAAAIMPNLSTACAVLQYEQGLQQTKQGMNGLSDAYTALIAAGDCKGVNANCSGAGRTQEAFADLCHLGLLSQTAYGDLSQQMSCVAPYPGYVDRDKNLDVFLHTYQMPMATACILQDGFPYFSSQLPPNATCQNGVTADAAYNPDPTKSKLAWVAAFKLCENMGEDPVTAVATSGRSISGSDIAWVMRDRKVSATQIGGKAACFRALFERTACPSNTANAARSANGTAADTCAAYQLNLCHYLRDPPNGTNADVSGMKGGAPTFPTTTGLGINDPILDDCINQGTGLSVLMAEKIMSHACANNSHMELIVPNQTDASSLNNYSRVDCSEIRQDFEELLRKEEKLINEMVNKSERISRRLINNNEGGNNGVGGAARGATTMTPPPATP